MKWLLIYTFSFLTEGFIVFHYTSCFFVPRFRMATRLVTVAFLYLVLFLVSFMESAWLNVVAFTCANGIFLFTQYHSNFFPGILHLTILTALMSGSESAVYGIISNFAPHFYYNGENGLALLLFVVFNKLLFLFIVYFLMMTAGKRQIRQDPADRSALLLLLIPLASIFIILTFITIGEGSFTILNINALITVSTILLLLINLLIFGIHRYSQERSRAFAEMQFSLQKESDLANYYELLSAQNENQKILIHDFKKHLLSIFQLNEQNKPKEIDSYIQELLQSSGLSESVRICDNKLLNAILCRYRQRCADTHLTFHADIRSRSADFLENSALTSLFCNLLDNAIEAAAVVPDGYVELMVQKKERTPFTVVTCVNSCKENPLSFHGRMRISPKADGAKHGVGLKSIRRTVKQYDGDMKLYYDEETQTFHALITLRQDRVR